MELTIDINGKILFFKTKDLYFYQGPQDMKGCAVARFHYISTVVDVPGFKRAEKPCVEIDLRPDSDKIWGGISPAFRKSINKGQRANATIQVNEDFEGFKSMFSEFMKAKGFGSRLSTGTPSIEEMRKGTLISAKLHDELVCGNLYLEGEEGSVLWVSASKRLFKEHEDAKSIGDLNKLIHWMEMTRSKEKGLRYFSLGTIWPEAEASKDSMKESLNTFKFRFGGETVMKYSYEKNYSWLYTAMFNSYNRLVKIRKHN